ncbi:hypothetical protein CC86DRAFT_456692 [Ophiobolus disseminans]|uniref:Uncharacterized protein n=1 Tax=Ophiobolus disseminans TaxID=1469910 RepID=A0A6A6ZU90_9PLEO|nr:hypothetical protein CC86DRAFT_456692 [Ophiobolus disseminans]
MGSVNRVCTPGSNNPFTQIHDGLETACKEQKKELIKSLSRDIGGIFQIREHDLERMCQHGTEESGVAGFSRRAVQLAAINLARACLSDLQSRLQERYLTLLRGTVVAIQAVIATTQLVFLRRVIVGR